jgi:hypothetical protein
MRTLRLVGLSEDGRSLVLAAEGEDAETGERWLLPIDDRVRAAARGDSRRLTQIDVDLGTELPPRVIQARIRSGETPEQVAASSGTRVERIMRFAHPVLQERSRVAEQAREARVRLSGSSPSAVLHRFVTERLRLIDSDLDAVTWDAHRDDDGTWVVEGTWRAGGSVGTTRWAYDVPARTVTPFDAATTDFAEGTRLVRVVPEVPAGPPATAVHRAGRSVSMLRDAPRPHERPGSDPADEHLTDQLDPLPDVALPDVSGADRVEDVRDVHPSDGTAAAEASLDALLDEVAEHDTVVLAREAAAGDSRPVGTVPAEGEDPRARIPAWEDIVFGVRRQR